MTLRVRESVFPCAALAVLLGTVCAAAPRAQEPDAEEVAFRQRVAGKLHRHAESWFKVGFSGRARTLWREAVELYDPDHEPSWQALGYTRLGTTWAPDSTRPYPERDTAPPSRRRSLDAKWRSLAASLAADHRRRAAQLADAGDLAGARAHYRRALRFKPDDAKSARALGYQSFDGIYGDRDELALLRRSQRIRQLVVWLQEIEFPVEVLGGDERQPVFDRAGVRYQGVRSEHFTVWGDVGDARLREMAQYAERCVRLCRALFRGHEDYRMVPERSAQLAFFGQSETWRSLLDANATLFEPRYLAFLRESCAAAFFREGGGVVYAGWEDSRERLLDHVVRVVAHDLAGLQPAALQEGIGHAIVHAFFGRNLVFLVDARQETGGRRAGVTSAQPVDAGDDAPAAVMALAELDAWIDLALAEAWRRDDRRLAELPTLTADRMTRAQRVYGWAVCDYLMRRDPALLRALSLAGESADAAGQVEAAFPRYSDDVSLAAVETMWRQFWMQEERLLRPAMSRASRRVPAADRAALAWIDAFNRLRLELGADPVGWVRGDVPAWSDWAKALRTGPVTRVPAAARPLAPHGVVADGGDPAATVRAWLLQPGYRHALLDPTLGLVGCYETGRRVLFDVRPEPREHPATVRAFPDDRDVALPGSLELGALGGAVRAEIAAARAGEGPVGTPISLHFYGAVPALQQVECLVRCGDAYVEGSVRVSPREGIADRHGDAPGMATFYPHAPLAPGSLVTVKWSWAEDANLRLQRHQQFRVAER